MRADQVPLLGALSKLHKKPKCYLSVNLLAYSSVTVYIVMVMTALAELFAPLKAVLADSTSSNFTLAY